MNDVESLIEESHKQGLTGISISDHGVLSGHVKAERYLKAHRDDLGDFKVAYGLEAYLVHKSEIDKARKDNIKSDFYHVVFTSKNAHGYKFLREVSTQAWRDSFFFRGMRRLPTYWESLEEQMRTYKGDVVVSTACLGSELSKAILNDDEKTIHEYVSNLVKIFGKDDVYFEIMPAKTEEQIIVNNRLVELSKETGVKYLVSTDAHYVDIHDQDSHETFLKSENQARDVRGFYQFAHIFSKDEIYQYIDKGIADVGFENSLKLINEIQTYSLKHKQEIPAAPIPDFKPVNLNYEKLDWVKYPEIEYYFHSKEKADQYFLRLVLNGMVEKKHPFDNLHLKRVNDEMKAMHAVSDYLNQPMSQYFLTLLKLIDIIWKSGSLLGPGRGSVGCFYIAYLLGISQINSIDYELPYWRFLSAERADDMPDVDLDSSSEKRLSIIQNFKKYFGEDRVLNFGTFNTQAPASTVLTACRGLQIDLHESQNIASTLPKDRMVAWSIHDTIYGNKKKGREPDKKFIELISQYPKLQETMLQIEGKVRGISQHASGVLITNEPYTEHNAMMLTQSSLPITQYDAHDSEYQGGLKYDILTLNALDRIHEAMRLLLKDNKIQWQGNLKTTYETYFGPDKLDMTNPKMFDMLAEHKISNAFEFDTIVSKQILAKMKPKTFDELVAANALMRLTVEDGEQPIDKYLRFRSDITQWYQEMEDYGLTPDEIKLMRHHLDKFYGICYSQETLMSLAMDEHITGFDLLEANKLRKSIAKKDEKLYEKEKTNFFEKGRKLGTSDNLLKYVWDNGAEPAKYYSFNLAHGTTYTLLLMVEMNIALKYGLIYWNTACLSVNAGIYGEKLSNTDYAKMPKAMADMGKVVTNPSINHSDYGFKPDVKNNKILFGLFPIAGISKDDCDIIIQNRPYKSLQDFMDKCKFTEKKMITLIKAGCFDEFNAERRVLMMSYIKLNTPVKEKLTTVQIPKIHDHIPEQFSNLVDLYDFRSRITGRNKEPMNKEIEKQFFDTEFSKDENNFSFENGELVINIKKFDKWYNKQITPLKEWLKTPTATQIEAAVNMEDTWKDKCQGNICSWEFETLSTYIGEHELLSTDLINQYQMSDFSKLDKNPTVTGWTNGRGKQYPMFEHATICGSVVDKNNKKNLIFLLDPQGHVVTVRLGAYNFKKFDKREKDNPSWLNRGNKLMVVGYRRDDNFYANKKNSGFTSAVMKIVDYDKNAYLVSKK